MCREDIKIMQIIVFQVGTERLGVEISGVEEIVSSQSIYVNKGSAVFHNKVIPILDLYRKLNLHPMSKECNLFIVIARNGCQTAIPVDKVEASYSIQDSDCRPVPAIFRGTEERHGLFSRIACLDSCLIPLIALERIFQH